MSAVDRDNFASLVNAELDDADPERTMRRFSLEEGHQAWDAKPIDIPPDKAVVFFVLNVVDHYQGYPDNGSE